MKTLKEEYIEYIDNVRKFTGLIDGEILKSLEITKITIISEAFADDPSPCLRIKKTDGTEYTIDGVENISKHLKELLKDI